MAIGNRKAKVTVIEYASVGCPHCAKWSNEVFPAFKAKYVDSGKARFVVRECLTGDPDLAAAGFLLARCAGPARYFKVIDEIYRRQEEIYQSGAVLRQVAIDAGLSDKAYTACLSDKAALDALQARAQRHVDVDKVTGTPTFDINGRRLENYLTLEQLDTAIAAAKTK
ncbi:MAG: DsbA family protein [Caulobacteraceae bacterium]|nr:DsbA family protein [Caulobacteraceae bacterium]